MYDVLLDLVYGSDVPELTSNQALAFVWGSIALTVFAFVMISLAFYKLMLYIARW